MDKLLIYLGEDLKINDQITIYQPSILDIAKYGENHYFNIVYKICSIPSDYKSELWDLGYNYSKLDDFELFILLTRDVGMEDTRLLFGEDISLKDMIPLIDSETNSLILYDENTELVITREIYTEVISFVREMHNIHPKRERAANKETLQLLVDEDRRKKMQRIKDASQESSQDSFLLPLISSMVNSPGFKYDIESLKNLGIYAFLDSVQRIQAINTAASISAGMYSGMVDISKSPNLLKQLNWLRDLSNEYCSSSNVRVTKTE